MTLGMFSSLRIRNYRLFLSGQVISNIGTWMQRVAQDWLVLELSGYDPVALGIAVSLQFLPIPLFSLSAGVLADRVDKRKFLIMIQVAMAVQAAALGLLDVSGAVQLWHAYLLCLVLGTVRAFEVPTRQSFVEEMVGPDQVSNAVPLNSTVFNMARIVGPAIAGFVITWVGTGWLFLGNAVSVLGVLTGLLLMNPDKLFRAEQGSRNGSKGQLREGLRYVREHRDLLAVMVLIFFVSSFGVTFFASLAIMAGNVFHTQADGYGLLSTLLAVGTFTGAMMAARRGSKRKPTLRLLLVSAFALGALELGSAFMPTYLAFGIALVPLGYATITFLNTANAFVQTSSSTEMRGRVMGLYVFVMIGGKPLGGPMTGWLAAAFGGRSPFIAGGLIAMLAAVVCAGLVLRRRRAARELTPSPEAAPCVPVSG